MASTSTRVASYSRRIVDDQIDHLLPALPALSLDGPKGVGKTSTALQRATTVFELDRPTTLEIVRADPDRLITAPIPVVIDEWQRLPASWDLVRRAVDDNHSPGQFIFTGSASPRSPETHSGAARIAPIRMRPLTLAERGVEVPSVSLGTLLQGARGVVGGTTSVTLDQYVAEILSSGLPGIRRLPDHVRQEMIDGYLQLIIDRDFPEAGRQVRNPSALRRWMTAYAAATATTASYDTIRDAATHRQERTSKSTTIPYRDTLERIWILDPVPAWNPAHNHLSRLNDRSKHHLADPALAAALLGANADTLLDGATTGPAVPRDGTLLGALFESLVALNLRVFAQANSAKVQHLRTWGGDREVDFIIERRDGGIVAVEVKLSASIDDHDVKHLHWLATKVGEQLLEFVVISTGPHAYRRPDGVAVIPAALLGP
jgi:uncharacterized protein